MGDAATLVKERARLLFLIRGFLIGVIIGLFLSGVTVFPLEAELNAVQRAIEAQLGDPGFGGWIAKVAYSLRETNARFPFLAYGFDWLAFAHLVIAVLFIGPYRDPVRNIWTLWWGVIACIGVIPLALIAGPQRGIPFYWQLIDSAFGIVAIGPLLLCIRMTKRIEAIDALRA